MWKKNRLVNPVGVRLAKKPQHVLPSRLDVLQHCMFLSEEIPKYDARGALKVFKRKETVGWLIVQWHLTFVKMMTSEFSV